MIMRSLWEVHLSKSNLTLLRCKIECNELMEINRRQTECLKMLEDEYKKLEDEHQRLLIQYQDTQKKKLT